MKNYSFKQVIVLVGGIPISGFGEGDDVVQIARRTETFDIRVGVDGLGVAQQSADESGTFTLRLLAQADSNTFLGVQFGLMAAGILPSIPVLVKGAGLLAVQFGAALECVIQQPAPNPLGAAAPEREWVIIAEKLVMI